MGVLWLQMTCGTKHCTQKLGQHILRHVSNFQHYEHDNSFVISTKALQKHFDKTNIKSSYCACLRSL